MPAMRYEMLLRSVYNCSRGGVKGADANVYRIMETAYRLRTDANWHKTKEVKELNYITNFTEVKMYVRNALRRGLEKIKYSACEEDIDAIAEMQTTLNQFHFYRKSTLDTIITTTNEIFRRNGLKQE
jgi:hypothetical protein